MFIKAPICKKKSFPKYQNISDDMKFGKHMRIFMLCLKTEN